jgi:hypothetical protein
MFKLLIQISEAKHIDLEHLDLDSEYEQISYSNKPILNNEIMKMNKVSQFAEYYSSNSILLKEIKYILHLSLIYSFSFLHNQS